MEFNPVKHTALFIADLLPAGDEYRAAAVIIAMVLCAAGVMALAGIGAWLAMRWGEASAKRTMRK